MHEPFAYTPRCSFTGCANRAQFKVAADWSDGTFHELKTYALACAEHLEPLKEAAERRRAQFPLGESEQLEQLSVHPLQTPGSAPDGSTH